MHSLSSLFTLSLAVACLATPNPIPQPIAEGAELVARGSSNPILVNLTVISTGGWALGYNTSTAGCPGANKESASGYCCPNGLVAPYTNTNPGSHACCQEGQDCLAVIETQPYCSRLTWVLWNSTTQPSGSGYFCCQGGSEDVGGNDMTCVANSGIVVKQHGGLAQRLGRPLPSGVSIAASILTAAVTSAASATGTPSLSATTTVSAVTKNAAPTGMGVAGGAMGVIAGVVAAAAVL